VSVDLLSLTPEAAQASLGEWLGQHGEPPYRLRQVFPRLWQRPVRRWAEATDLPASLRAPPPCAAYEAWAQRPRIERIEIVLATPSTLSMASMFGHVFLRLVQRPEDESLALEDRTVAFLVENAVPVEEDPLYAWKGIAGRFEATLVERSLLETYRTYVVAEGRDLRRFRLNVSPEETDALLERLWSLEHAGRFRYRFFASNCATLMVDLINSVLPPDRQVRYPEALATTPAGTLEGYAGAAAADGGPLVTFIPDTILSFEHQARAAAAVRHRLAPRESGDTYLWRAIESTDPDRRAGAHYQEFTPHKRTAACLRATSCRADRSGIRHANFQLPLDRRSGRGRHLHLSDRGCNAGFCAKGG